MVMASRLTRLSEKPSRVDGPEGRDDRQRQRDGGDQRGAPVAQEDEHDDDGEDGALDQRLHGRVVGAERVVDHRVDQLELDVRDAPSAARRPSWPRRRRRRRRSRPWRARWRTPRPACRRARRRCAARPWRRVTVPSWSRRTLRPLGSAIVVAARSSTVCLPASVRIACSRPPISPRPPARSTLVARSCRLTSPAVMPKASSRSGSSATRISRSTPPMRSICDDALHALQRAHDDVVDEPGQLLRRHAGRAAPRR